MPFDAFLNIEGICGESRDSGHNDWSRILSFSQGIFQPASATAGSAGGTGSSRATLSELSIVKSLDKSSTKIYEACCKGRHFRTVVLEFCHQGGGKFLEIRMEDVVISGVSPAGDVASVASLPSETVIFNFARILWTYTETQAQGSESSSLATGWDLVENRSWA